MPRHGGVPTELQRLNVILSLILLLTMPRHGGVPQPKADPPLAETACPVP
jgi:hypothetical protein